MGAVALEAAVRGSADLDLQHIKRGQGLVMLLTTSWSVPLIVESSLLLHALQGWPTSKHRSSSGGVESHALKQQYRKWWVGRIEDDSTAGHTHGASGICIYRYNVTYKVLIFQKLIAIVYR